MNLTRTNGFRAALLLVMVTLLLATGTAIGFELGEDESARSTNGVARVLGYEGYYSVDGEAVEGEVTMAFELHGTASGGTPLWSSSQRSVTLVDGRFSVVLGDIEDANSIPEDVLANTSLFVQISVEDNILSPRQRLAPAPVALASARSTGNFKVTDDLDVSGASDFAGPITGLGNGFTLLPVFTLTNNPETTLRNTPVPIAPNDGRHYCALTGYNKDRTAMATEDHFGSCTVKAGQSDWTVEYNVSEGVEVACRVLCFRLD